MDRQCIKQLVRHDEHWLELAWLLLHDPLSTGIEQTVPRARLVFLSASFLALSLLFLLELLFAESLELADLRIERLVVQCLQIWVPRDAEVEVLVVEALDLDLRAATACVLPLADP